MCKYQHWIQVNACHFSTKLHCLRERRVIHTTMVKHSLCYREWVKIVCGSGDTAGAKLEVRFNVELWPQYLLRFCDYRAASVSYLLDLYLCIVGLQLTP